MQERRYDGSEKLTQNPSLADFFKAAADPKNEMVALHNAPPVGSVIAGRFVTKENRAELYLAEKGVWRWK